MQAPWEQVSAPVRVGASPGVELYPQLLSEQLSVDHPSQPVRLRRMLILDFWGTDGQDEVVGWR